MNTRDQTSLADAVRASTPPVGLSQQQVEVLDELVFLDGTPRYATRGATGPAHVLFLERGRLETLIEREPRTLYAVMRAIVRATHALQTRLSMQAMELTNYVVKQHGRY